MSIGFYTFYHFIGKKKNPKGLRGSLYEKHSAVTETNHTA